MTIASGRPARSPSSSSAASRSSKPRRLRQPVSGSARETIASSRRRLSASSACQAHSTATTPSEVAKIESLEGSGSPTMVPTADQRELAQRADRGDRGKGVGERGEDDRQQEEHHQRAVDAAIGRHDRRR